MGLGVFWGRIEIWLVIGVWLSVIVWGWSFLKELIGGRESGVLEGKLF